MAEPLIKTVGLKKYFKTSRGLLHAVDNVNFTIEKGKTLGVVGESGCGKTTLGRTILRLTEPTDGQIFFNGKDITKVTGKEMHDFRRNAQIIFQDPSSSLNPRMSVGQLIAEPIRVMKTISGAKAIDEKVYKLMETVGLDERFYVSYPHELDGGRRQRIGVARALAVDPQFIVCDEPVSALDVSIQAQILNLLMDLQDSMGLTYMFITHDLSVVKHISTDIAVMYLGQCIEKAPTDELFEHPLHPYTQALLQAIPIPNLKNRSIESTIKGEISSPINPKPGCRFATRCPYVKPECTGTELELKEVSPNHFVKCVLCN
ncbi:MAG: ABC transporter ATP-binding protein [Lachnospiraceae bacterium]|nr:ABC transporter ATP-binding protein [Lachnospiraceae bacterium]